MLLVYLFISLMLFTLAFGSGIFPLFFEFDQKNQWILSISNTYAGGLFIGISFLHLLPEAEFSFAQVFGTYNWQSGPWPYMLSLFAYCLLLYLEKVQFADNHMHSHDYEDSDHSHDTSQGEEEIKDNVSTDRALRKQSPDKRNPKTTEDDEDLEIDIHFDEENEQGEENDNQESNDKDGDNNDKEQDTDQQDKKDAIDSARSSTNSKWNLKSPSSKTLPKTKEVDMEDFENNFKDLLAETKTGINAISKLKGLIPTDTINTEETEGSRIAEQVDIEEEKTVKNVLLALVLMISLSLHGFFEGAALGFGKSEISRWNLFIGKSFTLKLRSDELFNTKQQL